MRKFDLYDSNVYDYFINKQTKKIVQVIGVTSYIPVNEDGRVYRLHDATIIHSSELDKYYEKIDITCPVIRALYG